MRQITIDRNSWHYRHLFSFTFKNGCAPRTSNLCQYVRRCALSVLLYILMGPFGIAMIVVLAVILLVAVPVVFLLTLIIMSLLFLKKPKFEYIWAKRDFVGSEFWESFSNYSIKGTRVAPWLLLGPVSIWWVYYILTTVDYPYSYLWEFLAVVGLTLAVGLGFVGVMVGIVFGVLYLIDQCRTRVPRRLEKPKVEADSTKSLAISWFKAKKARICPMIEFV